MAFPQRPVPSGSPGSAGVCFGVEWAAETVAPPSVFPQVDQRTPSPWLTVAQSPQAPCPPPPSGSYRPGAESNGQEPAGPSPAPSARDLGSRLSHVRWCRRRRCSSRPWSKSGPLRGDPVGCGPALSNPTQVSLKSRGRQMDTATVVKMEIETRRMTTQAREEEEAEAEMEMK